MMGYTVEGPTFFRPADYRGNPYGIVWDFSYKTRALFPILGISEGCHSIPQRNEVAASGLARTRELLEAGAQSSPRRSQDFPDFLRST